MFGPLRMHILALMALILATGPARSDASPGQAIGVVVEDFPYLDTSGEPTDQAAVHQERLRVFMAALRRDVGADSRFRLVDGACNPSCNTDGAMDERLHAASRAGAKILIVGGIHKLSTLVQNAKAVAIDVASNRVVYQKLFTFRGDNNEAWERAEAFVAGDIRTALTDQPLAAAAVAPVALAIFDFELEDSSAAAQSTGETASDASELAGVTDAVRQLLAQSGRYRVIDVKAAGADAVKAHKLRECNGCDVPIARELGADQSLVGVIGRISRTEYTIGFQIRESRTGAVIASADSGLRMGANYSWSRGAVRLIRDRLLENEPRP
jgi:Protein of unknown function (DUF2380)